ncbi:MAG: M67 family metallopeptidase [Acidimicrobiia bacterium]|nr:M67 family metallopeptidase [Acidimicrobiia bacterium]
MSPGVRSEILEAMRRHAAWCAPEEACGLVAIDAAGVVRFVYSLTNIAHSPTRFIVDPEEHFGALCHAERSGWEVGGVFHSHPEGSVGLSETDVAEAPDPTWWYFVVAGEQVGCYRLGEGGVVDVSLDVIGSTEP